VRRSQLTEIEEFTPRNADGREPGELIRKPPRSRPGRRGPITSVAAASPVRTCSRSNVCR
jgi:hypothetical protein